MYGNESNCISYVLKYQGCESICEKKSKKVWKKSEYASKDELFNALKVWKWGLWRAKQSEIRSESELSHPWNMIVMVLGQLPMRTIPHQIKRKPNHCPPGPQSLGLLNFIPHLDNSPLGPLSQNKTTHQDQTLYVWNCPPGELSRYGL